MYVTRPISMYRRNPAALSEHPFGPNSGYLLTWDEPPTYTCFGLCKNPEIKHLPFPQDKNLTITYTVSTGQSTSQYRDKVLFIPVLNQPLSSNHYYAIRREGKHQGEASTSSKEEDMGTCCFCCSFAKDVKPKPLDPSDDYQQVEIIKKRHGFCAKSVASDGIPPDFLRRDGWRVEATIPRNYHLDEALGSNDALRAKLPDFNLPFGSESSESVVVGNWCCPFMFVKEGMRLKEQMKMSVFYEVTLKQRWEKVFSKENGDREEKNNAVVVDVDVQTEVVKVAGKDAVWDENGVVDRVLWFRSFGEVGTEISVGLGLEVVERMKWEQERFGWKASNGRHVRVERVEEFGGTNKWQKFNCYVLVESFVFRRMDGSLVLSYDFKHTHQIKCKWE